MNRIAIALVWGCLGTVSLGGCAGWSASPAGDQAFGASVRQAVALQTINPNAGREASAVTAVDSQALRNALARQRDSFKSPPQTFNVIGVTSSSAGQ